jgi:hypothetical protein
MEPSGRSLAHTLVCSKHSVEVIAGSLRFVCVRGVDRVYLTKLDREQVA